MAFIYSIYSFPCCLYVLTTSLLLQYFGDVLCNLTDIITIDQLAIANIVHWYCHVLGREDGHVLRRELDFEVEGQRKKGRPRRTWRKQVGEESVKVGLRRKDALCRSKWSADVNQISAGLR